MEDRMTDLLPKLLKQFEDAADSTVTYRAQAELWRDYYDGEQWTAAERATLAARHQPCITDNRVADKVQYLLGMERKTRTDPKAYPRTPQDEGSAEAATDAIRYVFDCNDFQNVRSLVSENMFVEGVGAAEVVRDGKKDKIRRIRWDRFYADPHSMELDYSDAQYLGVVAWFDEARLIAKYPKKRAIIEGMTSDAQRTYVETFDDKPQLRWIDVKRRRIQVFEHYFWDGGWKRAVFCKGGFLEDPKPSPYVDEDGVPECPIIAQAAYRDRDGNPYGVIKRYKDLQDEINKRRSKALHLLSTRRATTEEGAVKDVNEARKEMHRPDGIVVVTPGMRFDVDTNTELGQGQFNLLVDAIQALNATGPNLALQGQTGNISGRAKQLDQEGGAIQISTLFDQIRHFQKRVARASWNRVRQFWNEETWIRVTDDEQKLKFVGLNVPVTKGEQDVERLKALGLAPEEMQGAVMQIAMDPYSQIPVSRKNDVAQMHVDFVIEEAPDTVTLQQEQFAELVNLASAQVIFPPEVYIEASALRNKPKLLDMLKGGGEMSPEQQQAQQEAQMMQKAMAEAQLAKEQASVAKAEADTQKTVVETAVMIDNAAQPDEPASPA